MLHKPVAPINVEIQIEDKYMEKYAREYIEELFERVLRPQWLTMNDMEKITRRKRKWIMEYIVDDPFVRENELAKKDSGGQWLFDAEKIRPFLNKLFRKLPNY